MDQQLLTALLGILGGGTIVGIATLIVNKAQRKASLYETMQKTTTQHIEEQNKENDRLKGVISDLKKEKNEMFDLYKECLSLKETFTARIHELEMEVQRLRNDLIKANLFKN